jgi:hypothetical protein
MEVSRDPSGPDQLGYRRHFTLGFFVRRAALDPDE